jgi:CheY-like chemotaxis protein
MKWINEGAVDILDDLLLYEKIERDKLVLNLEPLVPVSDLKMILGQWRDNIELMMPENPAAFSGYRIKADLAHIKLVFKTLLGNSGLVVDYNSVAQRKILIHVDRVEASAAQPSPPRLPSFNSKVAPSSGMPFLRITMKFPCRHLSVLPHAASFERRGRNDGTGSSFSMFIAKSILELHGVETDLFRESSLSATTYHLDFPLYAAASSDSESSHHSDVVIDTQALVKSHAVGNLEADKTKVSANQNIVTQGSDRRLSVLVVDDSAMVRRVTAKLVARLGHTTVEACDGQKAVDLVASGMHFDVILMDNQMPVMTGVEATKIIRSVLGYKGMILGVTGNALEEDLTEFLAAGVSEVVLKPLTKEIFVNKTNNDDDFVYVL